MIGIKEHIKATTPKTNIKMVPILIPLRDKTAPIVIIIAQIYH
ncbi:MAG: hypothetical protein ACFFAK_14625 [Promethearchaeota archaeon]